MVMPIVRFATNEDKTAWDEFVFNHPLAVPYHLYGWKQTIEETYGHKAYYLLAEENGKITGVLPTFRFKIPFIKKTMVSLPFCDAGEALTNDDATKQLVVEKLLSLNDRLNTKKIEIRSCQKLFAEGHPTGLYVNENTEKVRMVLSLPKSSEILWKSYKSKLRSQIRKAEKNGLVFSWGSKKDIDAFYDVFKKNMRDLGSPVHSCKLIANILKYYGNKARMGLVYRNNQPVGGGIILSTKDTISIPWASTLREYNRLSPNMILYWNFLKYAADNYKKKFDFGRSTPKEGTYRFKKQWGAKPDQLYWYSLGKSKTENGKSGNLGKYKNIFSQMWQRMPLALTEMVGPKLRKYISL